MADGNLKLAVLGLGTMGQAMAGSALRSGIPTVVWNRDPDVARRWAEQGAEIAESVTGAVKGADMVITMVTDTKAVTSIAVDLGMLESLPAGAVWAQMSTIGVKGTATINTIVERQRPDVLFLDAPVSGSKVPAEQGKLTIFASGPEEARPTARTRLRGDRPTHDLARKCRGGLPYEAHQQHAAGVHCRRLGQLPRLGTPAGSRHPQRG
jgi:3-hydroxyisobutyrate dehydrogenase